MQEKTVSIVSGDQRTLTFSRMTSGPATPDTVRYSAQNYNTYQKVTYQQTTRQHIANILKFQTHGNARNIQCGSLREVQTAKPASANHVLTRSYFECTYK